jgi:hypothetical protein
MISPLLSSVRSRKSNGLPFGSSFYFRKGGITMIDNKMKAARANRLVEFGMFCNKVLSYKERIPRSTIRKLKDFQLSLAAARQDDRLGHIFENRLVVLDYLLKYAEAFNSGNKQAAQEFREKAIEAHNEGDRLINEVVDRGI